MNTTVRFVFLQSEYKTVLLLLPPTLSEKTPDQSPKFLNVWRHEPLDQLAVNLREYFQITTQVLVNENPA